MSFGPIMKELIAGLKRLELEETAIIEILLLVDTEKQADQLIEWIVDYQNSQEDPSAGMIMYQAAQIAGKMGFNE